MHTSVIYPSSTHTCQLRFLCQSSHNALLQQAGISDKSAQYYSSLSRRSQNKPADQAKSVIPSQSGLLMINTAIGGFSFSWRTWRRDEERQALGCAAISACINEPPRSTKTCRDSDQREQFVSRRPPFLSALFAKFP